MKRILMILMVLFLMLTCMAAMAEAANMGPASTDELPVEPAAYTWAQLATIIGATAATLLIVQYVKLPLDKVWKIPTRAIVYGISLVIMTAAQAFTKGLEVADVPLLIFNAFLVATSAMGTYEVTFAKNDAQKKINAP